MTPRLSGAVPVSRQFEKDNDDPRDRIGYNARCSGCQRGRLHDKPTGVAEGDYTAS
jgi:hypothetical protein